MAKDVTMEKKQLLEIIRLIFRQTCKHIKAYDDDQSDYIFSDTYFPWSECTDCVLRNIPCQITNDVKRDVCFAIWHEDILIKSESKTDGQEPDTT